MKPRPIAAPLDGEHLAALFPSTEEAMATTWRRRLNLFTGRSLTAPALAVEQIGRAGRFAARGQMLSPGVVRGLEVATETVSEAAAGAPRPVTRHFVNIAAGAGIAASGEDVLIPKPLRVRLGDIDVQAPAALAFTSEPGGGEGGGETPTVAPTEVRRLWGPLADLLRRGAQLPPVMVLVVQPVVIESIGGQDTEDDCGPGSSEPCEQDAESYAFEDWQLVDAARLVLYAWPGDWLPLPPRDARWRNRIAYAIFGAERGRTPDEPLPWEEVGVPIGLLAFDDAALAPADTLFEFGELPWAPLFIDRGAVVRGGGKPKRRSATPAAVPNPFLWQARIQQFAEHVASVTAAGATVEQLAAQLRYMPPVGLLPKTALDVRAGRDHFFPGSYAVEAVPVPIEQLDLMVQESAALAPYDLDGTDEVRVYVPVPQVWYEPALLRVEQIDPEFDRAIDQFTLRRGRWLTRRNEVRAKASALSQAISARPREFPTPDPDALEEEEAASDPIDLNDPLLKAPEESFGTSTVDTTITADALTKLKADLRALQHLRERTRVPLAALAQGFPFPASAASRIQYDATSKELIFVGRMTDAQRSDLLAVTAGDDAYRAAVGVLSAESQHDDFALLDERGVQGFIDALEHKVSVADDRIDFGFARVQTDIYRVRQFMLGTQGATRLATSPALADIAKGESALATQETLSQFLKRVKLSDVPGATPDERGGGGNPGESGGNPVRSAPAGGGPAGAGSSESTERAVRAGPQTVASGERFTAGARSTRTGFTEGIPFSAEFTSGVFSAGTTGAGTFGAGTFGGGTAGLESFIDAGLFGGGKTVGGAAGGITLGQGTINLKELAVSAIISGESTPSVKNLPTATPDDISQQTAIVGKALNFRTVTVAERLKQPPAPETKSFSVASKFTVLDELSKIGINVDDLNVPGFYSYAEGATTPEEDVITDPADPNRTIRVPRERTFTFADIRRRSLANEVLLDRHDPDPANGDEAGFFSASVRALDHTVAALRLVEGRVQLYRTAIELAKAALAQLQRQAAAADARLSVIADELAEARQDVSVAKALKLEEQARLDAINARRDRIIAEHVPFLAYQRSRLSDLILDVPARTLDPGLVEAPVPVCLSMDVAAPPELQSMIELLREAPIKWFTAVPPLLDRLDRIDVVQRTLDAARQRAAVGWAARAVALEPSDDGTRLGHAVTGVFLAQRQVVSQYRLQTAQLDVASIAAGSWARARDRLQETASLGDLVDAGHGRADVAQRAALEIEHIGKVAACLYERFGNVLPSIRLGWAERLSQYDAPVNLRNLASLPGWGKIDDVLERRAMQGMVDWLFGRVDARQPDAVAMINDLVRLCLLLASHAPVNRIIAGHVNRDTPVQPGGRVELKVDVTGVRVGMLVHMFAGAQVVARGVVEDLASGIAAARVLEAAQPSLAAGARAQFVEPARSLQGVATATMAAIAAMVRVG